ncbi:MAG: hypothetical protein ACRC2T_05400 [Thermoguttaceae bacterium]
MSKINTGKIRTDLKRLFCRFETCFQDKNTRKHLRIYITGRVSNLARKNCEAIALQANVPVRSVRCFIAKQTWVHEAMRNKIFRSHSGWSCQKNVEVTFYQLSRAKCPGVILPWPNQT